ncbi:hypothetical protein [Kingella oralis]|jgi:hypothetical protein|uniref:hypothetical protein n=1 Tax=Kingella oralis TaxID=505 RepID=UPI0028EF7363|nr:hypothetical protein [Kingella oralis]
MVSGFAKRRFRLHWWDRQPEIGSEAATARRPMAHSGFDGLATSVECRHSVAGRLRKGFRLHCNGQPENQPLRIACGNEFSGCLLLEQIGSLKTVIARVRARMTARD